jgi:hypothetical protein
VTTTETTSVPTAARTASKRDPSIKLVDLEVLNVVYDAASERLKLVRSWEQRDHGVAKTDLTDIGRAALTGWRPSGLIDATRRPPIVTIEERDQGFVAVCSLCSDEFGGSTRGAARSASRGHSSKHTRPFRFSMQRKTYDEIKGQIHAAGLSVAAVVQDGLETFARTGKF